MPRLNVNYAYQGTIARVVDGDTYDINVDLGFNIRHRIRVRLLDLDTPEVYGKHACEEGKIVSDHVKAILPKGTKVIVKTYKTGKYGRWLAEIEVGGNDLKTLIETFMYNQMFVID
jgi:micrococcal nuclease